MEGHDADHDDDDDDEYEHYETMDEFEDRTNVPKQLVIHTQSEDEQDELETPEGAEVRRSKAHLSPNVGSGDVSTVEKVSRPPSTRPSNRGTPASGRWRRSVEQALTKMTAEVAALREQLESRRSAAVAARTRLALVRRWIVWLAFVAVKHIIIDAMIIGLLLFWMKWKGDKRAELVVKLVSGFLSDNIWWRKGKKIAARAMAPQHHTQRRPATPSVAAG